MINLNIYEPVFKFLKIINENGFEAYLIGGSVRDYLLKKTTNDFDACTNAPLDFLEANFKISSKNKSFLNLSVDFENTIIQVTNFRKDIYNKTRFPTVSLVSSVEEDILRRDFTINCIYMNYLQQICYPLTSKQDMINKKIVCVNDPQISFKEDPLRMLRAINYAIKLGFIIEDNILEAMSENWHLIYKLSNSRLNTQIQQIKKIRVLKIICIIQNSYRQI